MKYCVFFVATNRKQKHRRPHFVSKILNVFIRVRKNLCGTLLSAAATYSIDICCYRHISPNFGIYLTARPGRFQFVFGYRGEETWFPIVTIRFDDANHRVPQLSATAALVFAKQRPRHFRSKLPTNHNHIFGGAGAVPKYHFLRHLFLRRRSLRNIGALLVLCILT